MVKKTRKRQKLGQGYIWFSGQIFSRGEGYTEVVLTAGPDGQGGRTRIKTGRLGAWKKIRLYAEWDE